MWSKNSCTLRNLPTLTGEGGGGGGGRGDISTTTCQDASAVDLPTAIVSDEQIPWSVEGRSGRQHGKGPPIFKWGLGGGVTAQGEIMHVRQSRSLEISSFLMSMWTSRPLLSDFTQQVWRRDSPGILTLPRRHAAVSLVCPSSNSPPHHPPPPPPPR